MEQSSLCSVAHPPAVRPYKKEVHMSYNQFPSLKVDPFEADLAGITQIQKRVFNNAEEFCLYRKGEFDNIVEIYQCISDFLSTHKGFLLAVANTFFSGMAATIALRERIDRKRKERAEQQKKSESEAEPIVLAVVSTKTSKNAEYLEKFQNINTAVKVISKDQSGRLRFFVSDKEFCFFFRRDENDFVGFTGSDKKVQDWLVGLFSQDCERAEQ
jgi:hypothetical protein